MGKITVIATDKSPRAIGPYSQGISAGGFVFTAGQIPLDPATGKLVEGEIEAQAHRVMANLAAVLEEGGSSLRQVVRLDVWVADLGIFPRLNAVLKGYFPAEPPARITAQAAALPMGAALEIVAIAVKG